MEVVKFQEKYRQAFIDFNTDWIVSNFGFLEEHDKETFEKIDEELNNGAMIFFVVENEIPLACCMSMPMEDSTWEICKLVQHCLNNGEKQCLKFVSGQGGGRRQCGGIVD
ncbi:MAG: hypothetical protein K2M91_11455 [Lachnospiraceae bacterium]|nr:hypothetical protein [Lachnospiraceae bacterium]